MGPVIARRVSQRGISPGLDYHDGCFVVFHDAQASFSSREEAPHGPCGHSEGPQREVDGRDLGLSGGVRENYASWSSQQVS